MTHCTVSNPSSWPRVRTVALLAALAAPGCTPEAAQPSLAQCADAGSTEARAAPDSGDEPDVEATSPNYDAAFPQDRVARLDIKLTSDAWQRMLDDMSEQLGKFGERGGLPGAPGSAGGGPPAELTAACKGLSTGAACTSNLFGMTSAGTCTDLFGSLICAPSGVANGPGGPGGPPGGGNADLLEETPIYVECDVATEDQQWKHVGMRFKGNSSLATPWSQGVYKLPLRLKFDQFEDTYPEVAKQRFYGFKNLNLSNSSNDQSLLREKLGNEVFRVAGFAAPASAFYRVYVDHGEGPIYFGLYTGIELPSDKAFLETHFASDEGNLYKPSGTGATFASWVQESFEKENNEDEGDYTDVKAVFDALHADRDDAEKWRAGLEQVFDVDTFLHWLALNTVIENWDAYGSMSHNYFLYANPENDGKLQWIPWDQSFAFSGTMGGFGGMPSGAARPGGAMGFPGGGGFGSTKLDQSGASEAWPLIRFMIDDSVYRAKYRRYVEAAAASEYTPAVFEKRFREAHALIAPYVVGADGEQKGYSFVTSEASFNDALDDLITHVRKRQTDVATYLRSDD